MGLKRVQEANNQEDKKNMHFASLSSTATYVSSSLSPAARSSEEKVSEQRAVLEVGKNYAYAFESG